MSRALTREAPSDGCLIPVEALWGIIDPKAHQDLLHEDRPKHPYEVRPLELPTQRLREEKSLADHDEKEWSDMDFGESQKDTNVISGNEDLRSSFEVGGLWQG